MELQVIGLVLNGLFIAFSFTLSLILIWHNWRKGSIQLFAILTLFMAIWNLGSLLYEIESATVLFVSGASIRFFSELGFVGAIVTLYSLTVNLVRLFTFHLKLLSIASLFVLASYQVILILVTPNSQTPQLPTNGLHLLIGVVTLFVAFRYRQRLESSALQSLIILFISGQGMAFFNSQVGASNLSLISCSTATLGIGLTLTWREVISPLRDRHVQIANVRQLAHALSENIELNKLLSEIMTQATQWLRADAAGIFLKSGHDNYRLVTSHALPLIEDSYPMRVGEGIVGLTIDTGQTITVEASDSRFKQMVATSFPQGSEVFGCVMTAPLTNRKQVIGAISVISNLQGKLFSDEDRILLEIVASEASIGVAYSHIAHEIESSRRNLENVLDATGSPIVTVNEVGTIQYANKTARELEQQGHTLVPPDWKATNRRLIWYEQLIEGVYYNCQSIELEGRYPTEWLIVYVNVTREKQMASLRDDVIRLTSHDIKNPLQGAMANLELLQEDLVDISNPDVQASLKDLAIQLKRIENISNTILGSGHSLINSSCELSDLLSEAVQEMNMHRLDNRHEILLFIENATASVKGSKEQLKRAFVNLIDNAIKYSPSGSKVRVVSYSNNHHENVVEVTDEGIGIPLSIQKYVFRPFFRGHEFGQDSHGAVGSGVGLNIVKSIIENHGGKIWFKSVEGQGTTFFVSLPASKDIDRFDYIEAPPS